MRAQLAGGSLHRDCFEPKQKYQIHGTSPVSEIYTRSRLERTQLPALGCAHRKNYKSVYKSLQLFILMCSSVQCKSMQERYSSVLRAMEIGSGCRRVQHAASKKMIWYAPLGHRHDKPLHKGSNQNLIWTPGDHAAQRDNNRPRPR